MRLQDLLSDTEQFLKVQGGCSTCPRKLIDFVPATLNPAKLIIVGEAPGATEVTQGEGFTGKSGQVLRSALRSAGITEYALTNTVHCRPPENKTPAEKEISCCMNQHVMSEVSPYPIVVLAGAVPTNAFFPGMGYQVRGNLAYHPDFPSSRFFSMLHPAAIGYDPKRKDEFYQQVDRLGRILKGSEPGFTTVTGTDFRNSWVAFLQGAKIISLDLETNRLESWFDDREIRSFAACGVPGEEVFVLERSDPFWTEALKLLFQYLQNPEKQVLGQNIGFDLVWLEAEGDFKCDLKYIHDLQGLYYQLKGKKQIALKPLVAEELDGYRHLVVWPHLEKDPEKLKRYNAEDVYYPQQLFLRDFPKLRAKTQDLFLRVLGPSTLAARRITHAGIYFKSENWVPLDEEFTAAREREIQAWQAESPEFDPKLYVTEKGFKDLDKYLYEVKKYPVGKLTAKESKPSTDEAAINELVRGGAKELEHLLAIKGIDKRRSTYIQPFPKLVAPDRRIHANYHNTTTSTGRLSSSGPNMQNNPRKEAQWQNQIRWCFGSPLGSVFPSGDFSQIELRIAMSLANDPTGIAAYMAGADIHVETAKSIPGMVNPTSEDRFKAKSANFALLYGGSWFTLQQYALDNYGVAMTDSEAKKWCQAFFSKYYALPVWHQKEIQSLRENKGYVESAVGHVWYFPDWDSNDTEVRTHSERSALNLTCQGPAAYAMTYLIILVQQQFWKKKIMAPGLGFAEVVLTVHDSLAWEVAESQVDESIAVVNSCLKEVEKWISPWFKVPLVLDTEVSTTWDKKD